jgi:hypothetical protein
VEVRTRLPQEALHAPGQVKLRDETNPVVICSFFADSPEWLGSAVRRNILAFLFHRSGHRNADAATRHHGFHPRKPLGTPSVPDKSQMGASQTLTF